MDPRTEFSRKVIRTIKAIPRGKVATYGWVAKLAGKPHGSRGVGWILHSCTKSEGLPWQRVLKAKGRLSFPEGSHSHLLQKKRLENEGVEVRNGRVDLDKYLWDGRRPSGARQP